MWLLPASLCCLFSIRASSLRFLICRKCDFVSPNLSLLKRVRFESKAISQIKLRFCWMGGSVEGLWAHESCSLIASKVHDRISEEMALWYQRDWVPRQGFSFSQDLWSNLCGIKVAESRTVWSGTKAVSGVTVDRWPMMGGIPWCRKGKTGTLAQPQQHGESTREPVSSES